MPKGNHKYRNTGNAIFDNIVKQFGSVAKACEPLGFSKKTIYLWIENNYIADHTKRRIRMAGYTPTFRKIKSP